MKIFSISLFLSLLFAVTACAPQPTAAAMAPTQPPAAHTPEVMMEKTAESSAMPQPSSSPRYVEYSRAALDQAANMRRVLFFFASWCPTCRPADADFMKNMDRIPADLVVIRVNYNDPETDAEEKTLAAQYGVTYQHTYVQIDAQGNVVAKWNGGQFEQLLGKVKS